MSSSPLPSDTADAKAAKAAAKKQRRAAKAQARAEARRARTAKRRAGSQAQERTDQGSADDAAAATSPSGLAAWRDAIVELWMRRIHPVLDVISPLGWALLGVTVACWIIGLTLHITELNVIAFALSVPLLIAALFVLGRARYAVTLDLQSHRVVVGSRAVGRVEVANPTQRSILPSRIELAVGKATAQFLVPRLPAGQSHEELFAVPTRKRAVLVVGPVRSVRDDPLSLMRRQVTWAKAQELYVHPRTVRLDEAASGFLRDLEGTPSSDLSSSDIAFHALRDYTPGDDRRHVHWRTTARTGKLMVRQFEETRRSHVVVALDNLADHYASEDEFELAVAAAASISAQTFREEKELTPFTFDARQNTLSYRQMMDDYTVVDPLRERISFHELGQKAADLAPNASAVMMVVGSHTTARELNAAATQLPLGVLAVAIRCVEDAEVKRSAIGSLDVVTVGSLETLARALRAVGR
ncbi:MULTISPECIES: DUF58 domain-containing protein [unclassified Brachybacterium]|uniref:DUF58 domain-containing protein n=1 Tax=unclassified Brachybacterium TaxID=2623841 RepID=UPI000C7FC592|nr:MULTISPECIES: DUF58 domain-containing protein [unclassified Brachybacterium]PMC74389.1 DUF58 domain-containing protein [Brachybacterium sp. UMB0905]